MAAETEYDERFVRFVVLFNVDEDYFECHEVMEELWLEEGRNLLYQGLLQAAVGLHHWRNDNFSGAVKLFAQAENKLVRYPDEAMGLDLRQLRDDVDRCLGLLRGWMERGAEGASTVDGNAPRADGSASDDRAANADGKGSGSDGVEAIAGVASADAGGPPPFVPFRLAVADAGLRLLAEEMAKLPPEQRLHGDDRE